MAELSIQFTDPDSEMFLNEDISGNKAVSMSQSETSDHPLPDNFWLRNYNNFSLVQNNDRVGKVVDKFGEEVNNNEHKNVYNKVYIMAMRGSNAFELERTIKLSFSNQDFHSNLFLQNTLFLLPMIGPVFWSCWPYRTEDEARVELKRRKGLKPVYVSECLKCKSCQHKNSVTSKTVYCSRLGLPIFSNDFSNPPPKNVISHLRIAGYLTATKPEYTWDDVRAAIIFPQKDNDIRSYYQYVPQKQVLPGAQYRKSLLTLNKLRNDAGIRQNKEKWDSFVLSTCNPLIIKIQESFLKNRQNDSVVNDYIKKIIIPNNHEIDCKQIIKSLKDDILLWAGIHIYLPAYQKCDCANQFLQRNHLRIPFAIRRNECTYCIDNKMGFCKRLECKLIGYKEDVPETDRIHAIEIIGNNHGIDRQIIDYCKSLERSDILSGLTKLRHILSSPESVSVYTGAGLQDLDTLPNQKISDDKAIEWVEKKIQSNCSILRIEAAIKQLYGLKKGRSIIQNVIFALKTMPSDHNELCLSDYQIDSSKNLNKLNKCITCSYATSLYCKKYNQKFALTFNTIPSEVNEILSVFNTIPLEVKLDTVQKSQPLEIEIDNPGDAISIDVRVENSIDDAKLWYETQLQKMEVEVPVAVEFENQLDIEMGEKAEGMVLDDSLL